ncbi:MAG: hypothetical protein EOO50_15585 [Flavobacterium sp.]|uniref:YEATS-associated helix-containing protein n=1 Tax=Flavobacterium sp. TaxID=239 RepID=UPI0012051A72|nr:YEATS-associated helix-containing protein [Flavobacterium sp.]RZJ64446.1 MAG: hypothetical protein EOO50_15585 [Flavobacterium sp.]
METFSLMFSQIDFFIAIIISSGIIAGWISYMTVSPLQQRHLSNNIKSMLFGIVFALVSGIFVHVIYGNSLNGIPGKLESIFVWCATFLPALIMSVAYNFLRRKESSAMEF